MIGKNIAVAFLPIGKAGLAWQQFGIKEHHDVE